MNYDEDRGGFNFYRRKKPSEQHTSQEPGPQTTPSSEKPPRGRPGRRKRTSTELSVSEGELTRRRRSARLSGEHDPREPSQEQNSTDGRVNGDGGGSKSSTKRAEDPPAHTPAPSDERQKGKKRATTTIALPFADTPVIMRNKEMRKVSSENSRRSSSGMRGRRASSLIDSGFSNGEPDLEAHLKSTFADSRVAVPHNEVKTEEFYKHISQYLPEPRRMMQLLTWCGARAVSEKPSDQSDDVNAVLAGNTLWPFEYVGCADFAMKLGLYKKSC